MTAMACVMSVRSRRRRRAAGWMRSWKLCTRSIQRRSSRSVNGRSQALMGKGACGARQQQPANYQARSNDGMGAASTSCASEVAVRKSGSTVTWACTASGRQRVERTSNVLAKSRTSLFARPDFTLKLVRPASVRRPSRLLSCRRDASASARGPRPHRLASDPLHALVMTLARSPDAA